MTYADPPEWLAAAVGLQMSLLTVLLFTWPGKGETKTLKSRANPGLQQFRVDCSVIARNTRTDP